jgi:hypothetical protein
MATAVAAVVAVAAATESSRRSPAGIESGVSADLTTRDAVSAAAGRQPFPALVISPV